MKSIAWTAVFIVVAFAGLWFGYIYMMERDPGHHIGIAYGRPTDTTISMHVMITSKQVANLTLDAYIPGKRHEREIHRIQLELDTKKHDDRVSAHDDTQGSYYENHPGENK